MIEITRIICLKIVKVILVRIILMMESGLGIKRAALIFAYNKGRHRNFPQ